MARALMMQNTHAQKLLGEIHLSNFSLKIDVAVFENYLLFQHHN